MNEIVARQEHAKAEKDEAQRQAEESVAKLFAKAIRADEENKRLWSELNRANSLLAIADDRVAQQAAHLQKVTAERDFYFRYGSAMSARLDHIFSSVKEASEQIKHAGADLDTIAKMSRTTADAAHQAYLLLSTLQTTIDNARLDARDAAYRPKIESPAQTGDAIDASVEKIGEKFGYGNNAGG